MNLKKMVSPHWDSLFARAGFQRRRPLVVLVLPAVALVAFGAAVGTSVGLMFAPSSGRRFRREFGDRFEQLRDRVKTEVAKRGLNAIQQ
jgi:hypothetical protein